MKCPSDPIEYMGHWLHKHVRNVQVAKMVKSIYHVITNQYSKQALAKVGLHHVIRRTAQYMVSELLQ